MRFPVFTPVVVERTNHFLQVGRRESRVDGRRLDVRMPEMLLHRTEVPVAATEQLHATSVPDPGRGGHHGSFSGPPRKLSLGAQPHRTTPPPLLDSPLN